MRRINLKQTEIGLIPEDWEVKTLKDITSKIFSGGTPDTRKPEYWNGNLLWLSSGETKNTFIRKTDKKITQIGVNNSSTRLANAGDIVIASAGQGYTRGQTGLCMNDMYVNQSIIVLRANLNICDNLFLFYNMFSRYSDLRNISDSNSSRGSLTTKLVVDMKIKLPNLKEQKIIGKILFDIDSKIELLQKQNETLEKIGQAIFKQWFVDFEFLNEEGSPYKSSGGEMVDSELGEIPKGWSVGKLGDFVDSVSGCSYTSKGLEDSEKALVTLKSISVNGFTQEGFKEYTGDYKDKHVVKDGDIVVAHTDLTQNRIILGKPAVVRDLGKYEVMIASMDLSIVKPLKLLNRPYLFYLLSTNMFYGHAQGYANGTTVIHLSRKAILEFPFIIPSEKVLTHFKEFSNHLFDKISINQKGIKSLEKTRDLLLPKLMTGKIRVPLEVEE